MTQWAYKVVYIDYRGRISCEGVETLIGGNERRSAFARRYLNGLGREGWEVIGIQPLSPTSAYYILKRPGQESDFADLNSSSAEQQQSTRESTTPPAAVPAFNVTLRKSLEALLSVMAELPRVFSVLTPEETSRGCAAWPITPLFDVAVRFPVTEVLPPLPVKVRALPRPLELTIKSPETETLFSVTLPAQALRLP